MPIESEPAHPHSPRARFRRLFGAERAVVGVVHLLPLPGSARWGGDLASILARARADADALVAGGVDGLIVENFGDAPFAPTVGPATVAAMARVASDLVERVAVPVGLNVLRNDSRAALAVAAASGGRFIRVNVHTGVMATDQGIVEGRAHETLAYRRLLGSDALILADVLVKHATPLAPQDIAVVAEETAERGLADALIVTGPTTGRPADLADLRRVRAAVPAFPVLVGSGVTPESVREILSLADGVIVGTALKRDGITTNEVDPERVRALVDRVKSTHGRFRP